MLRPLAFIAAAALGVTMMLPATAFSDPVEYTSTAPTGAPQTVAAHDYDVALPTRDGYTVELPPPPPEPEPLQYSVTPIVGILSMWPCAGPVNDGFGPRGSGMHNGIDVMCSHGAQLVATAPGVVVEVENSGSWGQYIKIDHGGIATLYSHLIVGSQQVAVGQAVEAGQGIGLVGDSGNASVSHCHFEVWFSGIRVDPIPWLP